MKILLLLLAALYGGQAVAADVAPGAEKAVSTAKPKVHKHKKDCVEKEGKPCHLSKSAGETSSKQALPAAQAPVEGIKAAATVAAPAAAKPEVKSEVPAVDALALAKKNNCLVCHSVDKKLVGPAWRDVAAKYRGDAGAEARLVNKVAKGGGGVWGSVPMPANSQVSEADRTTLVRFVLNLQ